MHYAEKIYRPPYEAMNTLLQVTTGCSHNNCSFCDYYPQKSFKVSPLEHIIEDLEEISMVNPNTKRIWLLNGDPFCLSYEKLVTIVKLIRKHLKNVTSIGMYASVNNIRNKTIDQLKDLRELGINGFLIGVESGDDESLKIGNTGYNSDDALNELSKLDEANIEYQISLIAGLGGKRSGSRAGNNTAKLLSSLNPKKIFYGSLFILNGTPLHQAIKNRTFNAPEEKDFWEEHQAFVTSFKGSCEISLMPDSNPHNIIELKSISDRNNFLEYSREKLESFSIVDEKVNAAMRIHNKKYLF